MLNKVTERIKFILVLRPVLVITQRYKAFQFEDHIELIFTFV